MTVGIVGFAIALAIPQSLGAAEPKDLVLRVHFAGAGKVLSDRSAAKIRPYFNSVPASNFWSKICERLSETAPTWTGSTVTANPALGPLLRPIFDDLVQQESWIEVTGQDANRKTLIAAMVPAPRAEFWKKNLGQLSPTDKTRLAFASQGKWAVIAAGPGAEAAAKAQAAALAKSGLPKFAEDHWLEADISGPVLAAHLPLPYTDNLSLIQLALAFKGEDVRPTMALKYSKPGNWKLDSWTIPTKAMKEPLASFCAVNGVASWLEKSSVPKKIGLQTVPNQLYGWSGYSMPNLTFAAAPMPGVTNLLRKMSTTLPAYLMDEVAGTEVGQILWVSNRMSLLWQGLPFTLPHCLPVSDPAGEFLMLGLFPSPPKGEPPAPELLQRVNGRKDLVYYHWEITTERVQAWRGIYQIAPFFTKLHEVKVSKPAQTWLTSISSNMVNTVTEVTVASPQELSLKRKGPIGLTGFELVTLTRWFDSLDMGPNDGILRRNLLRRPAGGDKRNSPGVPLKP